MTIIVIDLAARGSVGSTHCRVGLMLCGESLVKPEANAFDAPGQELRNTVHRMIGDALDHVQQIGLGIEAVHLSGLCRPPDYAERVRFP
jgi:hypothetical protein